MIHSTAFRLSRVEAEGWNEAQSVMMDEALTADEDRISMLNPHIADPERARWLAGFKNAVSAGLSTTKGRQRARRIGHG